MNRKTAVVLLVGAVLSIVGAVSAAAGGPVPDKPDHNVCLVWYGAHQADSSGSTPLEHFCVVVPG
jgi:hypothetical protein